MVLCCKAKAYFSKLPVSKSPIRGTPGERYRQKQLIKQLPAYDVDSVYCNSLTEEEMKQMELFLRMRKERCLGRGELRQREANDLTSRWVRLKRMMRACLHLSWVILITLFS